MAASLVRNRPDIEGPGQGSGLGGGVTLGKSARCARAQRGKAQGGLVQWRQVMPHSPTSAFERMVEHD
jgi:hypothetical protein